MIKLTNPFDNPVYISPSHIEMLEITTLYKDKPVTEQEIGVLVHLSSGKTQEVQECLRDIRNLIEEYWNQP